MDNEKKETILRIAIIMLVTFIAAFLAFYAALAVMINKVTSPSYYEKRMEKMIKNYERDMKKFESGLEESPFIPQQRPMLVNLVKENSEYKVIVNLKPLEGNEKGVDVKIKDNIISVNAELEKTSRKGEEIVNFSQSYYLDEDLITDKITKEKKGDKYIITIPFKD